MPEGIFHFASAGYVSRYEMAKFIFEKLSMDVKLLPCKTSDFSSPAVRPLNSRFDCSKIRALLDEPIGPWQEPLEGFLRQVMRRILVTGGAGFIGSNFVRMVLSEHPDCFIVNLDKLTYAGNLENLAGFLDHPNHKFIKGDICDGRLDRKNHRRAQDRCHY